MRNSHRLLSLTVALGALVAIEMGVQARAADVGAYIDDATITTKVKAALIDDKALKASNIHVDTTQSVVTLSGNVPSTDQKQEAERVASSVTGVKGVTDNMGIQ